MNILMNILKWVKEWGVLLVGVPVFSAIRLLSVEVIVIMVFHFLIFLFYRWLSWPHKSWSSSPDESKERLRKLTVHVHVWLIGSIVVWPMIYISGHLMCNYVPQWFNQWLSVSFEATLKETQTVEEFRKKMLSCAIQKFSTDKASSSYVTTHFQNDTVSLIPGDIIAEFAISSPTRNALNFIAQWLLLLLSIMLIGMKIAEAIGQAAVFTNSKET